MHTGWCRMCKQNMWKHIQVRTHTHTHTHTVGGGCMLTLDDVCAAQLGAGGPEAVLSNLCRKSSVFLQRIHTLHCPSCSYTFLKDKRGNTHTHTHTQIHKVWRSLCLLHRCSAGLGYWQYWIPTKLTKVDAALPVWRAALSRSGSSAPFLKSLHCFFRFTHRSAVSCLCFFCKEARDATRQAI